MTYNQTLPIEQAEWLAANAIKRSTAYLKSQTDGDYSIAINKQEDTLQYLKGRFTAH